MVNFGLYTGTIYTATGVDGTARFGNQALYNNYLGIGDWQPRIGLAWAPAAQGGKTVFRAGFGISSFMEGGGSNEELTQNLPFGFLQQQAIGGTWNAWELASDALRVPRAAASSIKPAMAAIASASSIRTSDQPPSVSGTSPSSSN